ncbi:hypothetical protein Tco_0451687 [Tanacetum coccineum]
MACSVPHTYDEIKAMVDKQIEEDKFRQQTIMNLAMQYDNACTTKDDLRNAYENCNDIPQDIRDLIEDRVRQLSIMNLAHEFNDACTSKDDLQKAYEECRDIPLEQRALIDKFLKIESELDSEMHNALL